MRVLTPRTASIAASVCDAVVAPADGLPAVAQTDTIASFDATLAAGTGPARVGLKALLLGLELVPFALGERARLRRLTRERRTAVIARLGRGPLAGALEGLTAVLAFSYFGDPGVSRGLGYDAAANAARGRALREAEGRW